MKSTSHLTRAVFRALIANRPYTVPECRRHVQQLPTHTQRASFSYVQRRSLFNAILGTSNRGFDGARNTPKNLEIALGRLVDLVKARRSRSRAPADGELLDAFKFIFNSRLASQRMLTRNEVYLTTEAFKHFQEKGLIGEDEETMALRKKDLDTILEALALPSEKERFRTDSRQLAELVFKVLPGSTSGAESQYLLPTYVTVLARTGSALEAYKLVQSAQASAIEQGVRVWLEILKGLAVEGRKQEFDLAISEAGDVFRSMKPSDYEELISFLASSDRVKDPQYCQHVYELQLGLNGNPTTTTLQTLLEFCARKRQMDLGQRLAAELEARIDEDAIFGTLLIWNAAKASTTGQLDEAVDRLLKLSSNTTLGIGDFNRLIEFCIDHDKSDMATAALQLAQDAGIQLNSKTAALQLKQELNKGNLAVAVRYYEYMSREDIPADDSDLPILNRLISAISFSTDPSYELLMRVVDHMLERNADFSAEALAGLCHVFLRRDELEDLSGLLRHRADFYPANDRARLGAVFREFILDPSIKDQRAFNAYELFRRAFPETSVEERLPIMQMFFDRKRSDLACLVFGHMRQREDIEARPTAAAYSQCFAGIAQCRDVDGLQMVYNMLKLDLEIEPNTKVRNGLMLAYIACQMPYTAMIDHFWKIMDSREGPTYSTFLVALRACEQWVPPGGYEARKVMAIVQAWNLEVTKEMYDCYIGSLAGQSEFENVVELIESMEEDIGERPDAYTIGTFYNAIPWQYRKDEVEKWAKKAYPELWEELVSFGDEIDEEWEIRYFKIDRNIDIEDDLLFGSGKYDPQLSRKAVQVLEPPST